MRKLLSLLLVAFVAIGNIAAQDVEEKVYLPEAGDWAIGFDAKPLLNFVGNVFNGSFSNTMDDFGGGEPTLDLNAFNSQNSSVFTSPTVSLMAKYMITDNLAFKTNVGILINNDKTAAYVRDDAAYVLDPLSEAKVADVCNQRNTGFSLLAGLEYRVGKKRVQGVFGGGLLVGVETQVTKYRYGNEMTELNQRPTTSGMVSPNSAYRPVKQYGGEPNVIAGLVGSAGVEWFVAPKIALGAEVSLCAAYTFNRQQYTVSQGYNATLKAVEERVDLTTPATAEFSLGTKNLGGSLYMAFYF